MRHHEWVCHAQGFGFHAQGRGQSEVKDQVVPSQLLKNVI